MYLREATGPVVPGSTAMLRQVDVLGVVQVGVGRVQDGVDDSGLQVQQHSTRDVVLIICLMGAKQRRKRSMEITFP